MLMYYLIVHGWLILCDYNKRVLFYSVCGPLLTEVLIKLESEELTVYEFGVLYTSYTH